jgi:hypothetical protein
MNKKDVSPTVIVPFLRARKEKAGKGGMIVHNML